MNLKGELNYLISGVDLKTPFLKELKKNIAKDLFIEPGDIMNTITDSAKKLVEQDKKHVEVSSKAYMEWAALLVACDEVIFPLMSSNDDRLGLMKKSLFAGIKIAKNSHMKKLEKVEQGKLTEFASKTINPYGNNFSDSEINGDFRSFKVSHCIYHNYFEQKHRPYLTQVMCSLEKSWYEDEAELKKNGLSFCKDDFKSIATGDDSCIFKVKIEAK